MSLLLQQRINIHFCVKLGWTFAKIKHGLHTCYQTVLGDRSVHKWIVQFRAGRTLVADKPRAPKAKSGRSRRNIRRVEDMVTANRRVMIREVSVKTGMARTMIQHILKKDLKLTKRCMTFVPVVLTQGHKDRQKDVCNFFLRLMAQSPRVFRNAVTMDESWIYVWDPALKIHSKEWLRAGEPRPQVA